MRKSIKISFVILAVLGLFFGLGNSFALAESGVVFGGAGDLPVVGDWNGDGKTEVGNYKGNGVWALDFNSNGAWDGTPIDKIFNFGSATDQPVTGDWNGDGKTEIGNYKGNGVWALDYNGNGQWDGDVVDKVFNFGSVTDLPVTGDWNCDGKTEIGNYKGNGVWAVDYNGNGVWDGTPTDKIFNFGSATNQPVTGDWNGYGKTEIGNYKGNGVWALDYNGNGQWDGEPTDKIVNIGIAGDLSVVGDWNADGKDEPGVYRPSNFSFHFPNDLIATCDLKKINNCSVPGTKRCLGNVVQICRDINNNGCLEWSAAEVCAAEKICSSAQCVTGQNSNSVPLGFDPGMKLRRAASPDLSDWNYFESCPDGPNGKCAGVLAPGSGFYTLGSNGFGTSAIQNCRMNTGEIFKPVNGANWTAQCPYYFNWIKEGDSAIADIKIDPRSYAKNEGTDFYLGLQENIHYGSLYGGLDFTNPQHSPYLNNINTISLKIRAKLCYKQFENEDPRVGGIFTYINWVNPSKNNLSGQFAIILFSHKKTDTYYDYSWYNDNAIKNEYELCGGACENDSAAINEGRKNIISIPGKYIGIVPQNYDFLIDNSSDCSASIESAPWLNIEIPVQEVIRQVIASGYATKEMLDGAKYSGGIVAGTEFWGRSLVELEAKDHIIYGKLCSSGEVSGCKICDANGTAWVDTDSRCAVGQVCSSGVCVSSQNCVAKTCATLGNYQCGSWSDGCSKTISCGACASGKACNSSGQCVVLGSPSLVTTANQGGEDDSISQKEHIKPVTPMTRAEILAKIAQIKILLIQLIQQLLVELQKQL